MGSWWRSADMTFISLIISEEAAPACLRELGVLGCLQFMDLNPELTPFQRRYVSQIKRCDEIERKLRYIAAEIKKLQIPIQPAGTVEDFVERIFDGESAPKLEALESKLSVYEEQLLDLNKFSKRLSEEYTHKVLIISVNNPCCLFIF
jgi:V-type H+-transporting ATPase subunit a